MLRANDIRALNGIAAEKDWLQTSRSESVSLYVKREIWYPVQSNDIIVALGGVEFDGESSRVAGRVRELSAKGDGAEPNEDWCLLARLLKEVCLAIHMARSIVAYSQMMQVGCTIYPTLSEKGGNSNNARQIAH